MKYNIHFFLFSIYPVLSLYLANSAYVSSNVLWWPLLVSAGSSIVCWWLLKILLKSSQKAALLTSVFIILFFSYGHFQRILLNRDLLLGLNVWLMPLWWLLFCIVVYFILRAKKTVYFFNRLANLVSLGVSLVLVFDLLQVWWPQKNTPEARLELVGGDGGSGNLTRPINPPDIYYIIVDGYLRSDLLQTVLGHDNSEFVDYLTSRRFQVAKDSRSNYPYTMLSLASSLNMDYLQLTNNTPETIRDYRLAFPLIYSNRVGRLLKSIGYRYVQIGSWWEGTNKSEIADEVLTWRSVGGEEGFNQMLLKTTVLYAFQGGDARLSQLTDSRESVLFELAQLTRVGNQSQPTFVFAHIICPHPPYIFGKNGEVVIPPEKGWSTETTKVAYVNQVSFLNMQLENTIDQILAKSQTPPIIIIQADHGWAWAVGWDLFPEQSPDKNFDRNQVFGIMNAYYLPNDNLPVYDSISPVNTFRSIFNTYFQANLPLLPDQSFLSDYYASPYKFARVEE